MTCSGAASPLFAAKVSPPRLRSPRVRADQYAKVAQAGRVKVLLVRAPAGYGKTTLVAAAADSLEWQSVWLRLDSLDADPRTFLCSLAHAAYRYDAWGSPRGAGNYATGIWTQATSLVTSTLAGQIASRQVLRYAGYAFDAESGLYYCSARYYDPATRQWTSGDPAKADGEETAYQYCGGEPVGSSDVTGARATKKNLFQRYWGKFRWRKRIGRAVTSVTSRHYIFDMWGKLEIEWSPTRRRITNMALDNAHLSWGNITDWGAKLNLSCTADWVQPVQNEPAYHCAYGSYGKQFQETSSTWDYNFSLGADLKWPSMLGVGVGISKGTSMHLWSCYIDVKAWVKSDGTLGFKQAARGTSATTGTSGTP